MSFEKPPRNVYSTADDKVRCRWRPKDRRAAPLRARWGSDVANMMRNNWAGAAVLTLALALAACGGKDAAKKAETKAAA